MSINVTFALTKFRRSAIKDSAINSAWDWLFVKKEIESESTYLVFDC